MIARALHTWWRRWRAGTRVASTVGLSIVEVTVAAALLAGSMVVIVGAIDSSKNALTASKRRTDATLLASQEIETMRSIPYTQVAFSVPQAQFEGRDVVVSGTGILAPSSTTTVEGVDFTVDRYVTWRPVDVGGVTVETGYKQATVIVSWSDQYGTHSTRADSAIASPAALSCRQEYTDVAAGALTGVVNSYYPGVGTAAAGAKSISVGTLSGGGSATEIAAGDLLLVVQMQGATLGNASDNSFGTIGSSGLYEYVVSTSPVVNGAVSVVGTNNGGLVNTYEATAAITPTGQHSFQVVRVPTYASATIGPELTAQAWNGSTGGVLALEVTGNLDWASQTVNVSGMGFRGGGSTSADGASGTDVSALAMAGSNSLGSRGEGVGGTPRYVYDGVSVTDLTSEGYPLGSAGITPAANGGGGGALVGGGGGGGAGYGQGGDGAWPTSASSGPSAGGGDALSAYAAAGRVFLGGGGGAGTSKDAPSAGSSSGGAGGGIVLVRATSMTGSGTVQASGSDGVAGRNTIGPNGGGGGGGGGTVVLSASSGLSSVTTVAQGGAGATGAPAAHAQAGGGRTEYIWGGGGGGGLVRATGTPAAVTVTGGNTTNGYGATQGAAGASSTGLDADDIPGITGNPGCYPSLTTTLTTSTSQVVTGNGAVQTATYTLTMTNASGRGTAFSAGATIALPTGFTYLSTMSTNYTGGAWRATTVNPSEGATSPAFGTFVIPSSASVEIVFSVTVATTAADGTNTAQASTTFATASGEAATASAADVASAAIDVVAFPCATPHTDADTSISGVVNTYYPVTASAAAGATSLTVGSSRGAATAIAKGDLLLVIQMQGATMDSTDTDAYGDGVAGLPASGVTSMTAGQWEYVHATGPVSGGAVPIDGQGTTGGLTNSYTVAAASGSAGASTVQVVRIPTYRNVTLTGTVTGSAWNGASGGIVAFDVAGALTMNGQTVDASGIGMRGGTSMLPQTTAKPAYRVTTGSGTTAKGLKGEGIAGYFGSDGYPNGSGGHGAPGNAGGGASSQLAFMGVYSGTGQGGGGGAGPVNAGGNNAAGGTGAYIVAADVAYGGSSPIVSTASLTSLIGGGGGGGGGSTAFLGDAGGAGGGIVVVRANRFSGSGTVSASGGSGGGTKTGAGGGGGGGMVILNARSTAGLASVTAVATGGTGGSTNAVAGAGAGGGGGYVVSSGALASSTVTGGAAGTDGGSPTATAGGPGTALVNDSMTLPGVTLGAGCRPVMTLSATASPSSQARPGLGSAISVTFTVQFANDGVSTASGCVVVTDTLPTSGGTPFLHSATGTLSYAGGATRPTTSNPGAGASSPSWSSFTVPAGGSVALGFVAANVGATAGTYVNASSITVGYGTYCNGDLAGPKFVVTASGPTVTVT
ncbi:MAG: beta strand repeat-containing protein [Acidimicrobiia bacterium]